MKYDASTPFDTTVPIGWQGYREDEYTGLVGDSYDPGTGGYIGPAPGFWGSSFRGKALIAANFLSNNAINDWGYGGTNVDSAVDLIGGGVSAVVGGQVIGPSSNFVFSKLGYIPKWIKVPYKFGSRLLHGGNPFVNPNLVTECVGGHGCPDPVADIYYTRASIGTSPKQQIATAIEFIKKTPDWGTGNKAQILRVISAEGLPKPMPWWAWIFKKTRYKGGYTGIRKSEDWITFTGKYYVSAPRLAPYPKVEPPVTKFYMRRPVDIARSIVHEGTHVNRLTTTFTPRYISEAGLEFEPCLQAAKFAEKTGARMPRLCRWALKGEDYFREKFEAKFVKK